MNDEISTLEKLHVAPILVVDGFGAGGRVERMQGVRLVIAGVDQGDTIDFEAKAECERGVVQILRGHANRADLVTFIGWLVGRGHLDSNPAAPIKSLDPLDEKPRRPSRALTVAECDSLLEATPCPTRRCLYLFQMRTGFRGTEAAWG